MNYYLICFIIVSAFFSGRMVEIHSYYNKIEKCTTVIPIHVKDLIKFYDLPNDFKRPSENLMNSYIKSKWYECEHGISK